MDSRYYCIKDFVSEEFQKLMYKKGVLYYRIKEEEPKYVSDEAINPDDFSVTMCLDPDDIDNQNIIGFCFIKKNDIHLLKVDIGDYLILEDYFLSPVEYRKYKIRKVLEDETD